MKVVVVGAGAIGGLVAAQLADTGAEVAAIARGPHLRAIQRDGLRVEFGDRPDVVARIRASDDAREVGPADLVFLGLKAYSYASSGPLVGPLLGPDTAIVPAQNGIPWWYFYGHPGPLGGHPLVSVDPGGVVTATLPPDRVIGCVPYPAAEIVAPGVVRHLEGWQFPLGEPDGVSRRRSERFGEMMTAAGFKSWTTDIRAQIWLKLLGNATFNPLSTLTGATMAEMCRQPDSRRLALALMTEVASVAAAVGDPLPPGMTVERRMAGAERVGAHKTSMLVDYEAGKPLELDVLLTAVIEIAGLVGQEVPHLETLHATLELLLEVGRRPDR
jgi:2-dehydropantoate 2-reductase